MRAGLAFLVAGYVLSQFYRAFLAVLSPVLKADIGATAGDLAISSGLLFLTFAMMQMPVGMALDRIGPRWTASVVLGGGGAGGALIFAAAQGPVAVHVAMALIGIGCAPVLMASYYIFARVYRPAVFGTLAGAMIGIGSLGNLAGTTPLALLAEAIGWRQTLVGLALVTLAVSVAMAVFLRDPPRLTPATGTKGTLGDLLRIPGVWAIIPLMAAAYAPLAAVRGLWAGPYLADVFGSGPEGIGRVTLLMGLMMVAGNFAYGPLDRIFGTRKWTVFSGNLMAAACLGLLAWFPSNGLMTATAFLVALGLFGSSFPAIMAHGRAFFPPHMVGRGVTLLNMFAIGGAGLLQFFSGQVHDRLAEGAMHPETPYVGIFLFFLVPLLVGLAFYLFSRDRTD
ncbi:MAG: MFS transporter [Rhodobacteraceae bacterium]|nr:MFS transporter [Paracoccaceae bacterium]MCP5342439.1 MFS transporter [Paracoccaceae bacterium]